MSGGEYHKSKGNEYFRSGQYQKAVENYSEAIRIDPQNVLVYSNRSLAYSKLKDYPSALADACKCVQIRPQWAKGFLRKAAAFEGLGCHEEVMQAAAEGFKVSSDNKLDKELVDCWFRANQKVNQLPEGAIDLPRGIFILSKEYLNVLVHLMRSLNGEQPLNHSLMGQCLYSCTEQMEKVLVDFGEPVSGIIKEWAEMLSQEIFPYNPVQSKKAEIAKAMNAKTEAFLQYLEKDISPCVYILLRPILGLIILVVLNRTNILSESNTGHHSAELMNTALLPLFKSPVLATDDYHSMYIGRICAVLDSFIGRGYKISPVEVSVVKTHCSTLEKAMEEYPKHLPEHAKDLNTARLTLNSVRFNILLPAGNVPPPLPCETPMSIEVAWRAVKEKPQEVRAFVERHLATIESVQFLTMRDVEDLVTMTGIFLDLGDCNRAADTFSKGEQAFFDTMGHLLSTRTLTLDQCPATIVPIRQLVFSEASMLLARNPQNFSAVLIRWKCLFTEFRCQLIRQGLGATFGSVFKWYTREMICRTPDSSHNREDLLLQHMQEEESLLAMRAPSILKALSQQSCQDIQDVLSEEEVVLDYIFFSTLRENPLLEAFCVLFQKGKNPTICSVNYSAVRKLAADVSSLLSLSGRKERKGEENRLAEAKLALELLHLSQILLPQPIADVLASGRIRHLYISPDADIALLPLDMLPFGDNQLPLFKTFSVSLLSCSRELIRQPLTNSIRLGTEKPVLTLPEAGASSGKKFNECYIIANPNFNLEKPLEPAPFLSGLIDTLSKYLNISDQQQEGTSCATQLDYSEEEAKSVAAALRSAGFEVKIIGGDQATVSSTISISSPVVFHISSHAVATAERTAFRGNFWSDLNSAIILTGYNTYASGKFDQLHPEAGIGQLPALAVCSMKLAGTKLVFLSTCISALGSNPAQEVISGLVEAFLAAGAETVVATLWPVADELAAEFSKLFYHELKNSGVRPSEALSYAKQQMQSRFVSHWFYWGAFTCYGLDRPLVP